MRNIRFAIAVACAPIAIGILAGPVNAGDYYDSGYRREARFAGASYSSDCCYRKIIRHWRSVRYERVVDERSRRRHYHRHYGENDGTVHRWRYSDDYYRPRRYVSEKYYAPPRYAEYRSQGDDCQLRRLWDGQGGWVWGVRRGCH